MGSKTTDMKHLLNNYFCVPVPKDAKDFVIDMGYLIFKIMDMSPEKWTTDAEINKEGMRFLRTGKSKFDKLPDNYSMWITSGQPLPTGQYEFIATDDQISEEQAGEIVETVKLALAVMFRDYLSDSDNNNVLATRKQSFQSLLRSAGIQGRVAVVKKVK